MISVFQIYFDEKSKAGLEPGFYPYHNLTGNDFFENEVMRQVYNMNPDFKKGIEYIGVSSWKQFQKSHIRASEILQAIQNDIDTGIAKDVYLYTPINDLMPSLGPDGKLSAVIDQPDIWHQHRMRYSQLDKDNHLLNNSGVLPFNLFDGKWQYVHCNYWICRQNIFNEYCKTVLIPALKFYERPEIQAQMPKWYTHSHSKQEYNSCCFTLEGLFGAFLAHSNYSYKYLCKKLYRRRYEWINITGYNINNLTPIPC